MKKITLLFALITFSFGFSQTYSGGATGAIPDDNCDVTNEFTLDLSAESLGVLGTTNIIGNVAVDITHTWAGDLNISIISPDGTEVDLSSGNGGSADNYTGTIFEDGAATPITAGTAPFTGTFAPEGSLASTNGDNADGVWTLRVCDTAGGDTGTVDAWSITFVAAPTCLDPTGVTPVVTSTDTATITWTAGGSETDWTYEYGVSPYTPDGSGTTGTVMTTPTLDLTGLTAGVTYDFYVQANCGGGNGDSQFVQATWVQLLGASCSSPVSLTVEADCSTATPYTLDYATSFDVGNTSCDTFPTNFGSWFEFVAPANGSVSINIGADTAEFALFEGCGNEVFCNAPASSGIDLTGLTPGATYQMAVWKDNDQTGTSEICLGEINCVFPIGLGATVLTDTTAEISWTDGNSPAATAWEYVVQDAGTGVPAGAGTATTNNPTSLMGLTTGNDYEFYVRADCGGSFSEWAGPFQWNQALPPANDEVAGAIDLPIGDTLCETIVVGTNVAATDSAEGGASCGTPEGDVWFSVTVPSTGEVTIETSTTAEVTDTVMTVYSGTSGSLVEVDCDDDGGAGVFSLITLTGRTPGEVLYVRVWEFGNDNFGTFNICAWSPSTLSTEDFDTNGDLFSYYPNPVTNTLTLNAQKDIQNVVVFNMLGQQVMRTAPNAVNSEVDMTTLNSGAYFVQVTINNTTETIRVIKN